MIKKDKALLIFLPSYQNNHESYYKVLTEVVFNEKNVTLLAYSNDCNLKSNNNLRVICPKKNEGISQFTLRNIKYFIKADLVVLEELYKVSFLIPLIIVAFGSKTLLSIHNVNKWLKRDGIIKKNFVKEKVIDLIMKNISGLIVISLSLRDYIYENKLYDKKVYYVPFSDTRYIEKNDDFKSKKEITFTIPGTVNTERRDYISFLKATLLLIEKNGNDQNIRLVLLGKKVKTGREENELIDKINKIKENTVKFWENYIDTKTFENEILNSNYLIGNININYEENLIKEIYGQSKETGALFLMLKYRTLTLFPKEYKSNALYDCFMIKYENSPDGIYNTMKEIIANKFEIENQKSNFQKHDKIVDTEIELLNNTFK